MERKYFAWVGLLVGLDACMPTSESGKLAVPLEGVWEGQNCASVETNAAGRRVFARTDRYTAGQVLCEITPTEVLHYHGGQVQVRARYTRTPGGFRLALGQGVGAIQVPGDSGEVIIEALTPTHLVVQQSLSWSDTTTLTSTITYTRKVQP